MRERVASHRKLRLSGSPAQAAPQAEPRTRRRAASPASRAAVSASRRSPRATGTLHHMRPAREGAEGRPAGRNPAPRPREGRDRRRGGPCASRPSARRGPARNRAPTGRRANEPVPAATIRRPA
jgi:hypothetical protein